jgi:hypothetical protein
MGQSEKARNFEPLRAVGVFMTVFGVTVMAAAFMDMPMIGRAINVGAGTIMVLLGVGGMLLGWKRARARKAELEAEGKGGAQP